mmetsp:Transcript_47014/g.147275  ORF Transcript_47014/g.147275 Transcript_47014/m.147275 type:complete len:182 (-) Transcript_47014:184-729(-)
MIYIAYVFADNESFDDSTWQNLEDSERIQVKIFGKVKIYLADQRKFQIPNADELTKLDSDITDLEAKQETLQKDLQSLVSSNDQLAAQLSNEELEVQVKDLKRSTKSLHEQIETCKNSGKKRVSVSVYDKRSLETSLQATASMMKKRKRLCMNALKELEAGSGMKLEELYDVVGIEEEETP